MEKDTFPGPHQFKEFSLRLADGQNPTDADIARVLGQEVVEPFRYAQRCLHGSVRRTTGEPAICHSTDVALRARDLGYPQRTIVVCLLHDTVEEQSQSLVEASRNCDALASISAAVARDVRLTTNHYSMIWRAVAPRLSSDLPFQADSLEKVREAIRAFQVELPSPLAGVFEGEFRRLLDYFMDEVDLSPGIERAQIDHHFTLCDELRLQSYRLYIDEMAEAAKQNLTAGGDGFYDVPLVVKALDLTDNLRTLEVASRASLQKTLFKTEAFLDRSFYLHEDIWRNEIVTTTFIQVYDYLKYHLVEQLRERETALSYLADTRFSRLAEHLLGEISRLREKYKVGTSPVSELRSLRETIQRKNEKQLIG